MNDKFEFVNLTQQTKSLLKNMVLITDLDKLLYYLYYFI